MVSRLELVASGWESCRAGTALASSTLFVCLQSSEARSVPRQQRQQQQACEIARERRELAVRSFGHASGVATGVPYTHACEQSLTKLREIQETTASTHTYKSSREMAAIATQCKASEVLGPQTVHRKVDDQALLFLTKSQVL